MSMFIKESYAGTKEIRKFTHSTCIPHKVTATTAGVKTDSEGRKYIPAGTILPANDATALGLVLNDTIVEYGDTACALLVHGFIDTTKIPVQPSAEAKAALTQVKFI
ncbi:MAG: hypothetical protein ACRCR2_03700 [Fusobacteriaceae bacterium]